ncbi:MAG: epoxyqueuosine reductase QueH [Clostridia bacterium]|nr:epoxyqueuosine reductase QueH [Clostridia bacterium]
MRKLLMHACCAPCFIYIEKDIKENGMMNEDGIREKVDCTACFYNPNIHPMVEYKRRRDTFIDFCTRHERDFVVLDEYDMKNYIKYVVENVGENKKYQLRCEYCYYLRLKKVFEYAKENHYDIVSTTLTISPYQKHEIIKRVGQKLEEEYGIKFLYQDYREYFREGQRMAREDGLYMQKYCGCVFSFDEGKWVY